MHPASTPALSSSRRRLIIAFLIAALLVLASRGLLSAYSYWGDEIFSVVGSQHSWNSLIPVWVLQGDVHPPLYHILLKGWMDLFGAGEIATRSLSFLCGIAALILLAWFTAKRSFRYQLLAILLLGTSPAFAYYMQETRSYALVLLLAMALTICALDQREAALLSQPRNPWGLRGYYILCIALSLTHYFGWIFVFCLTLINLLEAWIEPRRWKSFALLAVISIWPAIHVLYGALGDKTGGNFWIESDVPVLSTINHMLMGVFPLVLVSKEPYRLFLLLVTLAFLVRYAAPLLTRSAAAGRRSWLPFTETTYLAIAIALVTMTLIFIDLKTPMSTARNYIVLLPAVTFLLAGIFDAAIPRASTIDRRLLIAVAGSLLLTQLYASQIGIGEKAAPRENWKGLAQAVKAAGLCESGCYSDRANTYFSYYFQAKDLIPLPLAIPEAKTSTTKSAPAMANTGRSFVLSAKSLQKDGAILKSLNPGHVCLQPSQASPGMVVLVPGSRVQELKQQGLLPCGKP